MIAGDTGLPCVDGMLGDLYQTGYLHNHARMWLASYLVHQRKVHWRVGADWMFAHLLDGTRGTMFRLGVAGDGGCAPLHNSGFAPDEGAIAVGIRVLTASLLRWMECQP